MEQVYFQRVVSLVGEERGFKLMPGMAPVPLGCQTSNVLSHSNSFLLICCDFYIHPRDLCGAIHFSRCAVGDISLQLFLGS
jgi:hypothetical protein